MELLDTEAENSDDNLAIDSSRWAEYVDKFVSGGSDDIPSEVVHLLKQKPVLLGRCVYAYR